MSSITLTIHAADLNAVAAVVKNPFVVTAAESQATASAQTHKPKNKVWPPRASTLQAIRQRIIAYVGAHPGTTGNRIFKNVSGGSTNIGAELKAMRESGELRVVGNGFAGDAYRYFLLDIIKQKA
jgi:hypothetical protein